MLPTTQRILAAGSARRRPPLGVRAARALVLAVVATLLGAGAANAQLSAEAIDDLASGNAAVAAALEMDRSTPAGQMRAAVTLLDLGEPAVAGTVLAELVQTDLSTEQRAALVREFGAARFLELIRLDRPGVQSNFTGARQFAQSCLDAAAQMASDPQRIARMIAELQSDDVVTRDAARVDLQGSGDAAIQGLFAALAGAGEEPAKRAAILNTLAGMRPGLDQPLIAALAGGEGQFRRDLAELAMQENISPAALWLAALSAAEPPTPAGATVRAMIAARGMAPSTPTQVAAEVRKRLADVQAGVPGVTLDAEDMAEWWSWNQAEKQLTSTRVALPVLQVLAGARLLDAAEAAGPLPVDLARQAVSYRLQRAFELDQPPSEETVAQLEQMSTGDLSTMLAESVVQQHFEAAWRLAKQLGRRGDFAALVTSDGRPSPLAAAVASPNRKLRFAALEAVIAIKPQQSFAGASYVPQALWQFAAGGGQPTAVAASSRVGVASNWAGQLRAAGFDATPVQNGLDAIRVAADPSVAGRLGLIALDSDLGSPEVGDLIYQLRTYPALQHVPVAVLSSIYRLPDAERWAEADPATLAIIRPRDAAGLQAVVDKTADLPVAPLPEEQLRNAQAAQALAWIGELLAAGRPFDELARDANVAARLLLTSNLTKPSLAVLQQVGTHDAQTALVEAASNRSLPIETRQAAAAAFAANVAAHGLHLTRGQELQQFDRYNASETADPQTQKVLGQLLDVIEGN